MIRAQHAQRGRKQRPENAAHVRVGIGAVTVENLPFRVVYYPGHYGTFFAFAEDQSQEPVLCSCSRPAVENLLRLAQMTNPDREQPTRTIGWFFPSAISDVVHEQTTTTVPSSRFQSGLCHRCAMVSPSLRYCHEMYGTRFVQYSGWYINQAFLRMGISPPLGAITYHLDFLSDVCPEELHGDILALRSAAAAYAVEMDWFLARQRTVLDRAEDVAPPTVDYEEIAAHQRQLRVADRHRAQALRRVSKNIENTVRQEFGFRNVGEGWVSETLLYQIACRIFSSEQVLRHQRPEWLKGLELDIYIPSRQLALEYQGQQHFHPVEAWGGAEALEAVQFRDARKAEVCERMGVTLVTIDYTEPLTEEHVRTVLSGVADL